MTRPNSDSSSASSSSPRPCPKCGSEITRRDGESEKKFLARKSCGCRAQTRGLQPGPKARWLSRYGAGYIADAQYLAEVMAERLAAHEQRELPLRFWDDADWSKFFLLQVRFATKLLQEFSVESILAVLNGAQTAYSLGGKWLRPLLAQEEARRVASLARAVESLGGDSGPAPAGESFSYKPIPTLGKSLLSKLREVRGQGQSEG